MSWGWRGLPSSLALSALALLALQPTFQAQAEEAANQAGVALNVLGMLPVMARRSEWVAMTAAPDARIVGYLQFNANR